MRIATWNVNSVKARLPHVEDWLRTFSPDVLLLQELKCEEQAFPREALEDLGYNLAICGQKTYNGVAILSRTPLEDVQCGLPTFEGDTQSRYIEAVTNGVRVASVYVPNGQEVGSDKYAYKLEFYQRLLAHLKALLRYEEACVIGGDYNVAPEVVDGHSPAAFHDGRILCSGPERAAFHQLTHLGYSDSLRALYPAHTPQGQHLYSWWDYRAGSWPQNKGYRIDHLLLSPQASDRLKAGGIDMTPRGWERPSDHTPVWVEV